MQAVVKQPLERDAQVRLANHARLADRATILTVKFHGPEVRQMTVGELAQLPMKECVQIWKVSAAEFMHQQEISLHWLMLKIMLILRLILHAVLNDPESAFCMGRERFNLHLSCVATMYAPASQQNFLKRLGAA